MSQPFCLHQLSFPDVGLLLLAIGHLLVPSPGYLHGCGQSLQGALIFNDKGCATAPDKMLSFETGEQTRHRFAGNPKNFREFVMCQRKSQAKFSFGLVVFPYFPMRENPRKPLSC